MRRRLDRIRFRSTARREDESGDHGDSPNLSDGESVSEDGTSELAGPITFGSIRESEELRDSACVGTPTLLGPVPDAMRTESDKLNEVKGHLELALLEKHFLQEELRRLREEPGLEQIRQELERERCRCRELEANLEATSHSSRNEDKALCGERRDVLDGYKEEVCCSWVTRIRTVGLAWLGELYQLLQPLTKTKRDDTEEPLSARRLTENMRRVSKFCSIRTLHITSFCYDWCHHVTSCCVVITSATKGGGRLSFHSCLSVCLPLFGCLCAGYLKKLWTDLHEIWWAGWVCDKDELIRFW
uniref:Uncharacterized protein n=1 Tax=Eptatretus burgeri TaxID=7764 RepID=A0A8C4QSB1_EPTBU